MRDRPAERDAAQAERADIWHTLDSALVTAKLADQGWISDWTTWLRRGGALTRLSPSIAATTVADAVRVRSEVLDPNRDNAAPRLRGEVATLCTGSAHGLDDGTPVAAIALRAIALSRDLAIPLTAADRRATWIAAGVSTDEVSGTVLTWGLRPPGHDRWSTMMRERVDLGLVTHLRVQELRNAPLLTPAAEPVYACENPQVLQTLAAARVAHPVVCVSGNPAAAGSILLARVNARYHGDFDWPGVSIARRILAAGADPWRYGASHYLASVHRIPGEVHQPLTGRVDETPWDPALRQAMVRVGVAVHEEAVLETLLVDLR